MKPLVTLFAVACLCFAVAAWAADREGAPAMAHGSLLTPIPERPAAPPFDLRDPEGKAVRLSDFAGKPLVVNFWATWCPPCRAEMPSLERAWQTLKPEGIGVIAINVGEESDVIDQFTMETEVSFPLPMDLESRVIHQWQVRGLPTTYVVDAEGRLAYVATGEREWDDPALLDLVRALKKETR